MSKTITDTTGARMTVEERLAIRKKAALTIDPQTAEVTWAYALTLDPYGVYPELPEEYRCVGRESFARSPGSNIWVWFGDLTDALRDKLWEKHSAVLDFPAGFEPWPARLRTPLRRNDGGTRGPINRD